MMRVAGIRHRLALYSCMPPWSHLYRHGVRTRVDAGLWSLEDGIFTADWGRAVTPRHPALHSRRFTRQTAGMLP